MATLTIAQASCADDYDPNSMPVAKAREFIFRFLEPVRSTVRVPIRDALGRVLAEDVVSPVDVLRTAIQRWTAGRCAARISRPRATRR